MNVLYLSPWCPFPADNGFKTRVFHLAKALHQRHRLTLVSFAFGTADPGSVSRQLGPGLDSRNVAMNPFRRGKMARMLRFFSPTPIHELPVAEMVSLVQSLLRTEQYDLVIAASTMMAPYAFAGPSAARYLEEHNFNTLWSWERMKAQADQIGRFRTWVSWRKQQLYDQRVFRRFDAWSMVSDVDKRAVYRFLPRFKGHIEVVPNGVDCSSLAFEPHEPKANLIVFNGALTYRENFRAMRYFREEVYPEIRQQVPGVRLAITGSTQGVPLNSLMLDESVTLTGYLSDVRPTVAAAAVAVAPILGGGGTRLKILEAMALGTPVVATSKGAEGLELVDGEHLLIGDAPEQFASQVVRLLQSSTLRNVVRGQARLLVEERYDWSAIGKAFVDLAEKVVAQHQESRPA